MLQRSKVWRGVGLMIGFPTLAAIATATFWWAIKSIYPPVDERLLSLFFGVPWTIAAAFVGYHCWRHDHKTTAAVGTIAWLCLALMAAWITLAFWHG